MKKRILWLSTIGFVTAVVWHLFAPNEAVSEFRPIERPKIERSQSAPPATTNPDFASTPSHQWTNTAGPMLVWDRIESTDYRVYIDNLRSAGCPQQTIADIITADVHATCTSRGTSPVEEWQILRELLGELERLGAFHPVVESAALTAPGDRMSPAFLATFKHCLASVDRQALAQNATPEERGALLRLKTGLLTQLLSPDDYIHYDMAHSGLAVELRYGLADLAVSEDEFQAMFRLRRDLSDAFEASNSIDEAALRAKRTEFDQALLNILGMDRYAVYLRTQTTGAE